MHMLRLVVVALALAGSAGADEGTTDARTGSGRSSYAVSRVRPLT